MSKSAFQAKINLISAVDSIGDYMTWECQIAVTDFDGAFSGMDVAVGDVLILDTGPVEAGSLTFYGIQSITTTDYATPTVVAEYLAVNDNLTGPPDLSWVIGQDGTIARPSANLGLLPVVSRDIQLMTDKFTEYVQNYNFLSIVDNISTGGTGGGSAITLQDEGTTLTTTPTSINFTGTSVTATTTGDNVTVNVTGPTLTDAAGTPTAIGGIAAGTTFNNTPVEQILHDLLYPYQNPAFSSFTISGQTTPIEVGASVAGGSRTFTWATSNSTNVQANTIKIQDTTNALTLVQNSANDGTESISITAVTKNTAGTNVWTITGTNTHAVNFTRTYTVTWQWRVYYGESSNTSLSEADIKALRVGNLGSGYAATYNMQAGGYKWFAYPSAFGTASTFKDQSTNLDVPMLTVQVVSVTNANGVTTNYNVHRTVNILGSSINIVIS